MEWKDVGNWIKANAGPGAALVGSLLTGNIPGAVAAGTALVAGATGTTNPTEALAALQGNPETLLRLKELALQEQDSVRRHIEAMESLRLKNEADAHQEQQETIRSGDNAEDEYVRHTRPKMARQSWYGTAIYIAAAEVCKWAGVAAAGASFDIAMILASPSLAYIGFRSMFDKTGGFSGLMGRGKS